MTIKTKADKFIIRLAIVTVVSVSGLMLYSIATSPTITELFNKPKPLVEQTFYVATKGGIAYEVNAMHKCGEGNMRMAAIHATQSQTGDMKFKAAERILEALTMDHTRIYEGNIKEGTRCEITGVVFTNITGNAYNTEEK